MQRSSLRADLTRQSSLDEVLDTYRVDFQRFIALSRTAKQLGQLFCSPRLSSRKTPSAGAELICTLSRQVLSWPFAPLSSSRVKYPQC
jgi:hypothetical protein